MRTSHRQLNPSLKRQIIKVYTQTIVDLKDLEEAQEFLEDLFTSTELEMFSKRLAIAYWLKKGRSYSNIKQNLKVSSATIAEVATSMKSPGFQRALKKIEAEEWASKWEERISKAWPSGLKKFTK